MAFAGKPAQIVVEGQVIPLTRYGWVPLVDEQEQFVCQRWLALHYPDGKILDSSLQAVRERWINQAYQCEFDYGFKQIIVVYQKIKYKNQRRHFVRMSFFDALLCILLQNWV